MTTLSKEDKIKIVIKKLIDLREITPKNYLIILRAEDIPISQKDIVPILFDLTDKEKVIADSGGFYSDEYSYTIRLLPRFDEYAKSLLLDDAKSKGTNDKIVSVIKFLIDLRKRSPNISPLYIPHPAISSITTLKYYEFESVLKKLHLDEKIVKIVKREPEEAFGKINYSIRILPSFDEYAKRVIPSENPTSNNLVLKFIAEGNTKGLFTELSKYLDIEKALQEYLTSIKSIHPATSDPIGTTQPDNKDILWLTYSDKTRKVLLNDLFVLSKPNFNSINDNLMAFLYKNPNRLIEAEELRKNNIKPDNKSLHKVINGLGFKNDLKDLFFSVSKDAILFRNPITQKDLIEANLADIRI